MGQTEFSSEVNLNNRLSYIPIPVTHVLREGKKYLVDSKELIVGDIVHLDSKISGIIPADIVLFQTSNEFEISPYTETFDSGNKHLK